MGLTKPVPLVLGLRVAGFLVAEEAVAFVAVEAVGRVEVAVAFAAGRAVALAVAFGAAVLFAEVGVLTAAGDFVEEVGLAAALVVIALGRVVDFLAAAGPVAFADPDGAEEGSTFGLPFATAVPAAG